jgi:hypothetical protein
MCCFSRAVPLVASTKIFARPLGGTRQALAYAMDFAAAEDLALVLPIPTPIGAGDDAVEFVDLSACPDFFARLERAFPLLVARSTALAFAPQSRRQPAPPLVVHEVGDFQASFVPSVADFARLDARFRLPVKVWDTLPLHRTYGFVVAKLRATGTGFFAKLAGGTPKRHTLHPLAFTFPRRDPSRVFFPTVHVHDGEAHAEATFDHALYVQAPVVPPAGSDATIRAIEWEHATGSAASVMDSTLGAGLLAAHEPMARAFVHGERANEDLTVLAG